MISKRYQNNKAQSCTKEIDCFCLINQLPEKLLQKNCLTDARQFEYVVKPIVGAGAHDGPSIDVLNSPEIMVYIYLFSAGASTALAGACK